MKCGILNAQGLSRAIQGKVLKEDINTRFQQILQDKVPYVMSRIQMWKVSRCVGGGNNGNKFTT
jgi:hypothetical protein